MMWTNLVSDTFGASNVMLLPASGAFIELSLPRLQTYQLVLSSTGYACPLHTNYTRGKGKCKVYPRTGHEAPDGE
jgi:hypothetical protein